MTRSASSASLSVLGSEFDAFLFAPIGEDSNGMRLSVLSLLARLDLDPWQEAAKLAGLPGETAAQNLASIIAAQPDVLSARRDPGEIATRLTALLPRPTSSGIVSRSEQASTDAVAKFRTGICMYVVLFAFMFAAQWIAESRLPSAQVDDAHAPASTTGPPLTPPSYGR